MIKTTIKIDGMHCGMCESRVNEIVRLVLPVKKVTSSHATGKTVVLTEKSPDKDAVTHALEAQGYRVLSIDEGLYEKKGLFGLFDKRR